MTNCEIRTQNINIHHSLQPDFLDSLLYMCKITALLCNDGLLPTLQVHLVLVLPPHKAVANHAQSNNNKTLAIINQWFYLSMNSFENPILLYL